MLDNLSRRSFVVGGACLAAGLAAESVFDAGEKHVAFANGDSDDFEAHSANTVCHGCSSRCGLTAYCSDRVIGKMVGHEAHPRSLGSLCVRGFGYADSVASSGRIATPLRKGADGSFAPVSWEEAIDEVVSALKSVDASKVAFVGDGSATSAFYGARFMHALGSANVYAASAKDAFSNPGALQVVGSSYEGDFGHADMMLLFEGFGAHVASPGCTRMIEQAKQNGGRIVYVGSRYDASVSFATEWLAINPGTELAFVLALSNHLLRSGLYDDEFVCGNVSGFEQWAESVETYTPTWAERIVGVAHTKISELANALANAAPRCFVQGGGTPLSPCANPGEVDRAIAILNSLLGCWDAKGGALRIPDFGFSPLDESSILPCVAPDEAAVGMDDFPLASFPASSIASEAARSGKIKVMIVHNCDVDVDSVAQLDFCMVISACMGKTAQAAHMVLPECSSFERVDLPEISCGKTPTVSFDGKVLDSSLDSARAFDGIIEALAAACGLDQYFDFSLEDIAEVQLASVGSSLKGAKALGSFVVNGREGDRVATVWTTPSGKIEFASERCVQAGLPACPTWVGSQTDVPEDSLRLVCGGMSSLADSRVFEAASMEDIAKTYGLLAAWMNATDADSVGIQDGDRIGVYGERAKGVITCHVTHCVVPGTLYLPGCLSSMTDGRADSFEIDPGLLDLGLFSVEEAYGSLCQKETFVTVKKVKN